MMVIALRLLLVIVIAVAIFAAFLYFTQDRLIYHPRPYRDDHLGMAPSRVIKIEYPISCGTQTAWYVPPRNAADPHTLPPTLWMLFGGNGSLALFWSNYIVTSPDPEAGYLMFDYPGYGQCEGKPSPASMSESGDAALAALAAHFNVTVDTLKSRQLRLMGHSLGAGVALAFAGRHPVDRLVLIAPFTSMRAMADMAVSPGLSWLLRHNFDNLKALDVIAKQPAPPHVIITHGTDDNVIPIDMSRTLKQRQPDLVDLIEIPNANHESILDGTEYYMARHLHRPLTSLAQARDAAENPATSATLHYPTR